MIRFNITTVFKFLTGVLLVQCVAGALVYAALEADNEALWPVFGVLGLGIGILAALWFSAIAAHRTKDVLSRAQQGFSKEREQIRVKAERDKTRVIKDSQRQIAKERNRVRNRANAKVGLSFGAVAVLGVIMLLTQFVTIGLLTLSTAGGALGGYLIRARQDRKIPAGSIAEVDGPEAKALGGRKSGFIRNVKTSF